MTAMSLSVPLPAPTVPPRREVPSFPPIRRGCGGWHRWRREVPSFPPIRRGCGGWHRWRRAVRRRGGVPALVLLAVAAALASGPARAGLPPPPGGAVGRPGCQSGLPEDHP